MRIEIIPYDITRHDEPGPFCGTPGPFCGTLGEVVTLPTWIAPAPRVGERLLWQGRAYTVDEVIHDFDRKTVVLRARRWPSIDVGWMPAKVAP